MTKQETKERLLGVRRAQAEAERYAALKRQAKDLACRATRPADQLPGGSGKGNDAFARYAQYADELDVRIAALLAARRTAVEEISRLSDSRYRELLLGYYVQGLTWERVAEEMGYTYQNVVQFLHPKALTAMSEVFEKESNI